LQMPHLVGISLRYIRYTTRLGLKIVKCRLLLVSGFSYVDWAGSLDDGRSAGGYAIFLGTNLVSWSARKQNTASRALKQSINQSQMQ
jgi:hypothetical protein